MFSISATSSDCGVVAVRARAPGSSRGPRAARRASGARRRRARSVPPGRGRTSTGCRTPRSLIDSASACSASSSKRLRGWCGLGATSSTAARAAPPRVARLGAPTGSPRVRGPSLRSAQPRAATSFASSKYASAPAQCGSWWITGRPKLGASPTRTLRGITVSKTSSGKCSRTSRSTSCAEARAPVVHRQQHPRDGQPRVELALDERERVEQAGEALEREVLGLHRHDHAVGGDQRVDRQRAERRRAVQQRVREALAHRRERVAQARLGARDRAAARRSAPARSGAGGQRAPGARSPVGDDRLRAPSPRRSARRRRSAIAVLRPARARPSRSPAGRCRRAASRSRPRRCTPRRSPRSSSCRPRPSGSRSRRPCPSSSQATRCGERSTTSRRRTRPIASAERPLARHPRPAGKRVRSIARPSR